MAHRHFKRAMKAGETGAPAHRSVARGVCVCVCVFKPRTGRLTPCKCAWEEVDKALLLTPPHPAPRECVALPEKSDEGKSREAGARGGECIYMMHGRLGSAR